MMRQLTALFLTAIIGLSAHMAHAEWPTWQQQGELFMRGTITDQEGRVWNVIIVPGVTNITQGAANAFGDAKDDITELSQTKFWKDRKENIKDGLGFSKDSVTEYWIEGIREDFNQPVENTGTAPVGQMGGIFFPIVDWTWFGVKTIIRTATFPIGVALGTAYSVVTPVLITVGKPVLGGLVWNGTIRGIVSPAVLYVWNGIAWVGTSVGHVPTRDSAFVRLIHSPEDDRGAREYVIDEAGFTTILQASVLRHVTIEKQEVYRKKIAEVDAKIEELIAPLVAEKANYAKEYRIVEEEYQQSSAAQAYDKTLREAKNSQTVKLSEETKEIILDNAALHTLIKNYLAELGITDPSDETIASIAKLVKDTTARLNDEMIEISNELR